MGKLVKLARVAMGLPIVAGIAVSFAWEIAKLSKDERDQLYASAWDALFLDEVIGAKGGAR